MKKFKYKIRKSLTTILLTFATSNFLKSQELYRRQLFVDVFSKSNDSTLIWYKNIDNNKIAKWNDYYEMQYSSNNMSKIDENKNHFTPNEKELLSQFFKGENSYIPSTILNSNAQKKTDSLPKLLFNKTEIADSIPAHLRIEKNIVYDDNFNKDIFFKKDNLNLKRKSKLYHFRGSVPVDIFSPFNDSTLIWYGSGDVDSNNVINWNDYFAMSSISNDMSDIDGNGIPSQPNDTTILGQFLRNEISHLPSDWINLDSTEKVNWYEKLEAIDNTDSFPYDHDTFNCNHFSYRLYFQFHGEDPRYFETDNGIGTWNRAKLEYNGRYNIPVIVTSIPYHSLNAIFVGDNPFDFKDYYFIEPQTDGHYSKDHFNNRLVFTNTIHFYTGEPYTSDGEEGLYETPYAQFNLDSVGNVEVISWDVPVIRYDPNKDKNPPELTINSPKQDSIYRTKNINLDYFAKDSIFIDSARFKLNDSIQDIDCSVFLGYWTYTDSISGEISLNPKEGKNKLIFYVDDLAKPNKNITRDTINFIVDTKIPKITTTSPINNHYYSSNPNLEVILQDQNLDSKNSYFKLNDSITYFPETQDTILNYTTTLNLNEGQNNLSIHARDKANNGSTISKIFVKDSQYPETNFSIQDDEIYSSGTINFNLIDQNLELDSCWYKINNSSKQLYNSSSGLINSSEIQEGTNNFISYVKDKAGNLTQDTIKNFIVDTKNPNITMTSPENNSYYPSNPNLEVILQDQNLDSKNSYFKLNDSITYFPETQDTILNYTTTLNLNEGQNNLSVYAIDKTNNDSMISKTFVKDSQLPTILTSLVDSSYYNSNPSFYFYLNDTNLNLDSCYYDFNESRHYFSSTSGNILLDVPEGQNNLKIHAEDLATNFVEKNISFIKDSQLPTIEINSPENNSYYSSNPTINCSISDNNLNLENSWYELNNNRFPFLNNSISNLLNSQEGQNNLKIHAEDLATNYIEENKNFIKDSKNPTQNISLKDSTYNYNVTSAEYSLEDENLNLDSCYYVNNGIKNYYSSTQGEISLNSKLGENKLLSHLEDYAENTTDKEINYTQTVPGTKVNENYTEKKFLKQNFPNPFSNFTTIKYTISKPEKISLKVYTIQGKELENLTKEYKTPNTYEKTFNTTSYSPGTYFYKLTTPEKTEVKKMIKIK